MAFDYSESPYPIRPDFAEQHQAFWQRLAKPGCWWTGAERVAIAQEVRNATICDFCQEIKTALSPYTLTGSHYHSDRLDEHAVDAVHRIVTDQQRITQQWIDELSENGLTNEAYVELAGLVVAIFSIDEFHRALGLAPEPLPEPLPGEPSHYRPDLAVRDVGFVPMLPHDGAVDDEADLWPGDRSANVVRALTLVPDALRDWKQLASAHYLSLPGMSNFDRPPGRAINRMQMELIAGRVSAINQCFY